MNQKQTNWIQVGILTAFAVGFSAWQTKTIINKQNQILKELNEMRQRSR
ncbi:hypothetical protein [Paenibacillus cremeus]|nr:hypothetical protein [Paenibacillus cremeus]